MSPGMQLFIKILLLAHAFSTWMVGGMILFVQVVYLPLYRRYKDHLSEYERKDLVHMGNLLAPILALEVISAIILAFVLTENIVYRCLAYTNVGLIVLIWIVNLILRWKKTKPRNILFIHKMHDIVLSSNWFRTICWSIRGVIVLLMILFSNLMH